MQRYNWNLQDCKTKKICWSCFSLPSAALWNLSCVQCIVLSKRCIISGYSSYSVFFSFFLFFLNTASITTLSFPAGYCAAGSRVLSLDNGCMDYKESAMRARLQTMQIPLSFPTLQFLPLHAGTPSHMCSSISVGWREGAGTPGVPLSNPLCRIAAIFPPLSLCAVMIPASRCASNGVGSARWSIGRRNEWAGAFLLFSSPELLLLLLLTWRLREKDVREFICQSICCLIRSRACWRKDEVSQVEVEVEEKNKKLKEPGAVNTISHISFAASQVKQWRGVWRLRRRGFLTAV